MISAFKNITKVPDLRKKLLVTLALIVVYRLGAFIPTPGIDGHALSQFFAKIASCVTNLWGLFIFIPCGSSILALLGSYVLIL